MISDHIGELRVSVQPRPDRSTSQSQFQKVGHGGLDAGDIRVKHRDVAAELLSEGKRHGIHQMGPANLDYGRELLRL